MGELTRGERNIQWIEKYCRIPKGKLAGQPVRLHPFQKDIIRGIYDSPTRTAIISFGRKNAKALSLDTPIITSVGWRTIGDIQAGDVVFGSDGKPCNVLAVSEVFENKECYQIEFSDGSRINCSGDHLWTTRHRYRPWHSPRVNGSGNGGRIKVDTITTEQIASSVVMNRPDGKTEYNHKLDISKPIYNIDIDLPIDPYLLGYWLGDGDTNSSRFTCSEEDIDDLVNQIKSFGNIKISRYPARAATVRLNGGFHSNLKLNNLISNKHIPDIYFDSGESQRFSLLQGLMDSDGTVNRHAGQTTARCSFTNINKNLVYGVWRLARSLGLKATIRSGDAKLNGRVTSKYYECSFSSCGEKRIFRLERKQKLLPNKISGRSKSLSIISCKKIESIPTKCLMVDSQDSLFLVGHGCIPTHNTAISAFLCVLHICGPEAKINSELYSAAQSRDQASILFSLMTKCIRFSKDLLDCVVIRETVKEVECPELGTIYKALSADAKTKYGLNPAFVVHDELGQVSGPRSELYDAMETACGEQEEPLSIIISTQAPTDADLLSILIDDALLGDDPEVKLFLYTFDPLEEEKGVDPFSEQAIRLANPAFDKFMNQKEVLSQANKAKRMPSKESAYRNLVLNQRIAREAPFISQGVWNLNNAEPREEDFLGEVIIGLDLSARLDLTALVYSGKGSDGCRSVRCQFFAPKEGVREKSIEDRVPYDLWAKQGFLTLTPGKSVGYDFVARKLVELCQKYNVKEIKFDRWRIKELLAELKVVALENPDIAKFIEDLPFSEHGQGFKDMAPALDFLESELTNGRIRHGGHPILKWNAANAVIDEDPAGNRKLNKKRATGRIDGIVAMVMSMNKSLEEEQVSVYERRGLIELSL